MTIPILIPLGSACRVRQSIDNYTKNGRETNLFDWNISDFQTILYFLKNIDIPFISSDFNDMNQTCITGHRMVNHNKLLLLSIHDFPLDKSYKEYMPEFLEKYNRRKDRLKQLIQTQKGQLHFIHFLNINTSSKNITIPTIYEITQFHEAIRKINPNCLFHLELLVHPNYFFQKDLFNHLAVNITTRVHHMRRLYNLNVDEDNENIRGINWNWNEIFDSLNDIDKLFEIILHKMLTNT